MEVEELLTEKGIEFKISGGDLVVRCLNPDHEDRHPSMRIDRMNGVFNCFSCQYKGNIFRHFGIETNKLDIKRSNLRRKISDTMTYTIGLEMPKGFTPVDFDWRGVSGKTMQHFEAFKHSDYPDRIVFPLHDIRGKIMCFIGRHTNLHERKKKYLIDPRHVEIPLYPSPITPIHDRVLVVEGIFDMLNLYDKGIFNVVCAFGTSGLSEHNLSLLRIFNVGGIDILFDSDENKAGQKGADKFKTLCENNGFDVRVLELETGTDPGDMDQKRVDRLRHYLYS